MPFYSSLVCDASQFLGALTVRIIDYELIAQVRKLHQVVARRYRVGVEAYIAARYAGDGLNPATFGCTIRDSVGSWPDIGVMAS
jgi:hypothetical protein